MVYTKNKSFSFAWDDQKAASNSKKHGVSFELGITVFDDPSALLAPDEGHSTPDETREWIIGLSDNGVLVVVFTTKVQQKIYRIISARKANRKERGLYEEFKKFSI